MKFQTMGEWLKENDGKRPVDPSSSVAAYFERAAKAAEEEAAKAAKPEEDTGKSKKATGK